MMGVWTKFIWDLRRRWWNLRWSELNDDKGVNLFLDDERTPKIIGWYHAATVEEAIDVLTNRTVWDASFDHDLGPGASGYDLVWYLARTLHENGLNFWPKNKPRVHSANPPGKQAMESVINRYGPYDKKEK